jgi:peptide/nickel transport system permease protein
MQEAQEHPPGLLRRGARRFFRRWPNVVALIITLLFVVIALGADILAPQRDFLWPTKLTWPDDPMKVKPHSPNRDVPLGTVVARINHQVDVYTVLVHGTRSALKYGLIAALLTAAIGILIGGISALLGGFSNSIAMRITDGMMAFPVIVGVFMMDQLLLFAKGDQGYSLTSSIPRGQSTALLYATSLINMFDPVVLAIILFSWMPYARLTNSIVMRVKQSTYIEAARALGAENGWLLLKHLLPNSISPSVVLFARDIGGMVVLLASLTFIGIGANLEWGWLMAISRSWLIGNFWDLVGRWWMFIPVVVVLILFGTSWNLLGDGLNDWLNPYSG